MNETWSTFDLGKAVRLGMIQNWFVSRRYSIFFVCTFISLTPLFGQVKLDNPESKLPETSKKSRMFYDLNHGDKTSVLQFYKEFYLKSGRIPNGWTGNTKTCQAGENTSEYNDATLQRINYYRMMAGLSPISSFVEEFNQKAIRSSLIMEAQGSLSHYPTSGWHCFSEAGKEAAGKSNLALEAGAASIDSYILDPGASNYFVGHRRWILFPSLATMGTGSTKNANSLWVMGERSESNAKVPFVAWPPEGYVPVDLFLDANYRWSFSVAKADFSKTKISMTSNGKTFSVIKEKSASGFGDNTIVWRTNLRLNQNDNDQKVKVTLENVIVSGETKSYSYDVIFFIPFSSEELTEGPTETISINPDFDSKVLNIVFKDDPLQLKKILESGGNPNAMQPSGWSALLIAANKNHTNMAKLLVLYGAKVNFNMNGWTPLKFAQNNGNQELIEFFEKILGSKVKDSD
ncbi:ankyrin repeat domain-containing protein [Leptospira sp. 96542]|nr:ankyrin repeat domain-containing protein [Leptospira sp. 96542]